LPYSIVHREAKRCKGTDITFSRGVWGGYRHTYICIHMYIDRRGYRLRDICMHMYI